VIEYLKKLEEEDKEGVEEISSSSSSSEEFVDAQTRTTSPRPKSQSSESESDQDFDSCSESEAHEQSVPHPSSSEKEDSEMEEILSKFSGGHAPLPRPQEHYSEQEEEEEEMETLTGDSQEIFTHILPDAPPAMKHQVEEKEEPTEREQDLWGGSLFGNFNVPMTGEEQQLSQPVALDEASAYMYELGSVASGFSQQTRMGEEPMPSTSRGHSQSIMRRPSQTSQRKGGF